ncbi:MAG: helix-turn-helix transcriptional regulator [Candidatus Omnitrophica bacterium]|nr:helix-turn-helix transcriptional regulator [Candidatus Omnitrophota bacterium]
MKEQALKHYIVNIALQIRNLRKKSKLTQVDFAKRAGVGLRFIRELEGGKTTVRMDKLMQVLDFLGYRLELRKNDATQFTVKHSKTDLT